MSGLRLEGGQAGHVRTTLQKGASSTLLSTRFVTVCVILLDMDILDLLYPRRMLVDVKEEAHDIRARYPSAQHWQSFE